MNQGDLKKNCLISIGVILLYFFWPTILHAFWNVFSGKDGFGLMIYQIAGYLILIAILVVIYHNSLKENWIQFWKEKKNFGLILKYTLLLFVGVLVCNAILQYIFHIGVTPNETELLGKFQKYPIWILVTVTLYYPFVEIIVFQKTIRQVIKKPWLFILISSIFFGYFNIAFSKITWNVMIGTLPYLFLNAILAFSYYKTDNIMVPIGTKMFYNLLVTIISFL